MTPSTGFKVFRVVGLLVFAAYFFVPLLAMFDFSTQRRGSADEGSGNENDGTRREAARHARSIRPRCRQKVRFRVPGSEFRATNPEP